MIFRRSRITTCWSVRFFSLLALIGLLTGSSFAASEVRGWFTSDGITGRPAATRHGWDREKIYISGVSNGLGYGADSIWSPRGWFSVNYGGNIPGGQYTMFSLFLDGAAAFTYMQGLNLPDGSVMVDNLQFQSQDDHYSVMYNFQYTEWGAEPWVHGTDFYQTFVAVTPYITRVATTLADKRPSYTSLWLNYAIYQTNAGPPSTWTRISPIRTRFLSDHTDPIIHLFDVQYRSNEMTLIPGQTYALRLWRDPLSTSTEFSLVARPDSGNGYAGGHIFNGDTPMTGWDAYAYISGGIAGTVVNHAPVVDVSTVNLLGWNQNCGQTFIATGSGLAAVEFGYTVGCDGNSAIPITFTVYDSVGGTQIGPSQTCIGVPGFCQARAAAFWEPGQVPLVPGQKYYVEMTGPGCNVWDSQDDLPGVEAYVNRVSFAPTDLLVSIAEYTGSSTPGPTWTPTITPTPTLSPTPITQQNLLLNGDMEQGPVGSSGQIPTHWTTWTGSGTPTFWHNNDCGRNGTLGARAIGGAINGNLFDAGFYQQVTGLVPGRTYGLTGWVKNHPGRSASYMSWVGYDLTGQTSNGLAASVAYFEVGGMDAWEMLPVKEFTATGSSVTVFLRARNISFSHTFFVDFDDMMLYEIGGTPAATSTHTPTATRTNTQTMTPSPTPPFDDADGDGIPDTLEGGKNAALLGKTNMYLPDSDGDGLGDGVEDANRNGAMDTGETNALSRDSDGDGYEDGVEVLLLSSNPLNPASPVTNYADADGDGLPDSIDPAPANPDADGDRFLDGFEAVVLGLSAVTNAASRPSLGDVDLNQNWDNADAQRILNFFANVPQTGMNPAFSDLNRNGVIDNADAQQSLNFFANLLQYLPVW